MSNASQIVGLVASGLFVPTSLILALQFIGSRAFTLREKELSVPGLHAVPLNFEGWSARGEDSLESNVTEYLKPDEYILRDYSNGSTGNRINLFVAYFKSLQNVYGPHSPRVCLPGNGWWIRSSQIASIRVPGRDAPVDVNEYFLDKSGQQIVAVYWYQNDRNVWAEEFWEKFKLLPDLITYRRSDVSLVRLISPLNSFDRESVLARSIEFAKEIFPVLAERFATVK
jgi:EpsI family protein